MDLRSTDVNVTNPTKAAKLSLAAVNDKVDNLQQSMDNKFNELSESMAEIRVALETLTNIAFVNASSATDEKNDQGSKNANIDDRGTALGITRHSRAIDGEVALVVGNVERMKHFLHDLLDLSKVVDWKSDWVIFKLRHPESRQLMVSTIGSLAIDQLELMYSYEKKVEEEAEAQVPNWRAGNWRKIQAEPPPWGYSKDNTEEAYQSTPETKRLLTRLNRHYRGSYVRTRIAACMARIQVGTCLAHLYVIC